MNDDALRDLIEISLGRWWLTRWMPASWRARLAAVFAPLTRRRIAQLRKGQ